MDDIGRALVVVGLVVAAVGTLLVVADAAGLGRLPGDLVFRRGNVRIYVPLATSLILSLLLTVVLGLLGRR
jgi:hypothetical protein